MNQPTSRELRFLVTQKCNYNCVFCHGEGLQSKKSDLLNPEDIRFLYSVEGINSSKEELKDLIEFAESINSSIKFIELFPPNSEGFVPLEYLRNYLVDRGFEKIPSLTRKEKYSNRKVIVGLIKIFCAKACETSRPADYCTRYNDLFVSPDGKIKPCRNSKFEVDVLDSVKSRNVELTEKGMKETFDLLGKNCIYERRK